MNYTSIKKKKKASMKQLSKEEKNLNILKAMWT